jgi:hypothetical protein
LILVDYSQASLSAILSFQRELRGGDEQVVNLIRHVVLNMLQSYKKKYGKEYGELVICCDGRDYWRRDVFPYYKAGRKKARDESGLPWKLIFDTISQLKDDIASNFPYRVLTVPKAEADDIIAVLCKHTQENLLQQVGLVEDKQPVLIISSDHDFKQLHQYDNVKQWSPKNKKFIPLEKNYMKDGHIEHIVKAGDDGIPSILSPDDIFLQEGVRQKPVSAKRLAEFKERGFDACRDDTERRNWHRNERLIDFHHIPQDIYDLCVGTYINTEVVSDKTLIMNYLIKNKCRELLNNLEDF